MQFSELSNNARAFQVRPLSAVLFRMLDFSVGQVVVAASLAALLLGACGRGLERDAWWERCSRGKRSRSDIRLCTACTDGCGGWMDGWMDGWTVLPCDVAAGRREMKSVAYYAGKFTGSTVGVMRRYRARLQRVINEADVPMQSVRLCCAFCGV